MQRTLLKIVKILAYQPSISEENRKELIDIAGDDGLFLGQEKVPKVDDTPVETYLLPDNGIKAYTWDGGKEFFFYTDLQDDVENAMQLMGYDSHGYSLSFFKDRKEPETPEDFEWPLIKEGPNAE